jgi:2',3'-cyclic-nucleotide 2'-phosphodiesterase (5'-nucleotidase family)
MPSPRALRRARVAALSAVALTAGALQLFSPQPAQAAPNVDIQILATNDFHGRIANDPTSAAAGAAAMATYVKQARSVNPNTVFAAAGDLIGASTFESFIAKDKPTLDSLKEAGLEVSAAGNHEFDQGYDDLVNRVMKPYDASTNPNGPAGGLGWKYIAANVRMKSNNSPALDPSYVVTKGGVNIGFVGAVTEHLPELVSPAGISMLNITDIVTAVNAEANTLKASGADIIVLLVHEGAASTNCATMDDDPTSDFGSIITGVNDNVDAIVSGHTHLAYDCTFPVAGWSSRPVKERSVVSAGQYGAALNKLNFNYDLGADRIQSVTHTIDNLKTCPAGGTACGGSGQPAWVNNYAGDSATASIVSAAVTQADVLGAAVLGKISGPFYRGKLADGSTENRGAESTVGNLVAEVQRWATRLPESGSAQIAFMNPGGLRADMTGTVNGSSRDLTYKQAATVQPFANTLVNMKLTGAQIKTVLEQQWQPAGASRPFLKLGISRGFTYTFNDALPQGSRITGMYLDGAPINPATVYSVTVNSFLAAGGDNFLELNNGKSKQDTGKTDLQGMVDYMAANGGGAGLPVDARQNGVGIAFPAGAPAAYKPGDHVKFNVSSWSMTNANDLKDASLDVLANGAKLGSAAVDSAAQAALPGFDTVGKAAVDVVVPLTQGAGPMVLTLSGPTTGTKITVPVTVTQGTSTVTATPEKAKYKVGKKVVLNVTVTGENGIPANGQATAIIKGGTAITVDVVNGKARINLGKFAKKGKKKVEVQFLDTPTLQASTTTVTFKVKGSKKK